MAPCKGCVLLDVGTKCEGCVLDRYLVEPKDMDKLQKLITQYKIFGTSDALIVKLNSLESQYGTDFAKYFMNELVREVESFNLNDELLKSTEMTVSNIVKRRIIQLKEKQDERKCREADNLKLVQYMEKLNLMGQFNEYTKEKEVDLGLADLFAEIPPHEVQEVCGGEVPDLERATYSTLYLHEVLNMMDSEADWTEIKSGSDAGVGGTSGMSSVAGIPVACPSDLAVISPNAAGPPCQAVQVKQLPHWQGHGPRSRKTAAPLWRAAPLLEPAASKSVGVDYVDLDEDEEDESEEDEFDPDYVPEE